MLQEVTHDFFQMLNERFAQCFEATGVITNSAFLTKLLNATSTCTSHFLPKKPLKVDERDQLLIYLQWLFNQLVFIALNTKNDEKSLEDVNIALQKSIAHESFLLQRWWFHQLIDLHNSLLSQALTWETITDIQLNQPSEEDLKKVPVKIQFFKITIDSEQKFNNIIKTSLSVLSSSILHYCNIKPDLSRQSREVVLDVICHKSLLHKKQSLEFLQRYFASLATFTNVDTQFFLNVLETLMIIETKVSIKCIKLTTEKFLSEAPAQRMQFENQQNQQRLVSCVSDLLYQQLNNRQHSSFNPNLPEILANMLTTVLDNFKCTLSSVESLSNLVKFDDLPTVSVMKYLVVAELEEAVNIPREKLEVAAFSKSWKTICSGLSTHLDQLFNTKKDSFFYHLNCIAECFILANQIEFRTAQRFQYFHGMRKLESNCPWNFKPMQIVLFDDLSNFTQKLLSALEKHDEINAEIARCSMDIFGCILKLSNDSTIVDTMKQVLIAIVASPFYARFHNHLKYKKLGGFIKVLLLLPPKFKTFFSGAIDENHLRVMECDAVSLLSQLEVNKINPACWWLIENIIVFITSEGSDDLKTTFYNSFVNFTINNKIQICFEKYMKLMTEFKDLKCLISPLEEMLCIAADDVVILKLHSKENDFKYLIVCNKCISSTMHLNTEAENEVERLLFLMKHTNGLIVGRDRDHPRYETFDVEKLFDQPKELIIELIAKTPALLNHSPDFRYWINSDQGKGFFGKIFINDEKVLEHVEQNLERIIKTIHLMDCDDNQRRKIFDNCLLQLSEIVKSNAYGTDSKLQLLTVNVIFTFATNVVDENNSVKCFKIFLLYMIQNNSQVMGEASDLALKMAERNGVSLLELFNWHKTFIMQQVTRILATNFLEFNITFLSSITNLTRRLNFPRCHEFVPSVMGIIISIILPLSVRSPKLLTALEKLCATLDEPLPQAISRNILIVYHSLYTTQKENVLSACIKIIENKTDMKLRELLIRNQNEINYEVLIYFNKSQKFVFEVMSNMFGKEVSSATIDRTIAEIKTTFLGVLIYMEPFLTSVKSERVVKSQVLLSLGDIIRMLGTERVSSYCFKIITVLKAALDQNSFDLSDCCMQVYDILIRTCSVSSMGPILSTIFVSLEQLIDKYPKEVNGLYEYLVIENSNLLSRHISELFFIEKTRVGQNIKTVVLSLMKSQKMRDEENFYTNLKSLIQYLKSDNSDLNIRVYCLQYLKELFQKNRLELNVLICGQMTMDSSVDELLHILINNCKTSTSELLQLATVECLGELGAIEPSLQQHNYAGQEDFPQTIHSDEFAKMALAQLCKSYQYKNDTKYIDALSLAIQQILQSREVTVENRVNHDVWNAIPEKMQPLMEPLLRSSYSPKQRTIETAVPIFLVQSQTAADWAFQFASVLINRITDEKTKYLLECIKPSMRHNQYTTSMFFPYIMLHNLEMSDISTHKTIKEEIQYVFDVVMEKDNFMQNKDQNYKKPLYVTTFEFRPIHKKQESPENGAKPVAVKVAKMIFEMFDFLENFSRTHTGATSSLIRNLLDKFDTEEMALVNYKCGEYARAMIYFENCIKNMKVNSNNNIQKKLNFLTNIYVKLGSTDSVVGIQAFKTTEWSLGEKLLINNVTGNYKDSAAASERMMQIGDPTVEHIHSMLNTFIALDQPEIALLVYEKMFCKLDDSKKKELGSEFKAEPLWRLSRFDELEELLKEEEVLQSTNWGVRCGQLLLKFRADNHENFQTELRNTRIAMMKNLKISGNEQTSYEKNYREFINFHLIAEFEKVDEAYEQLKKATNKDRLSIIKNLVEEWNLRMEFVQAGVTIEEPIFCFHRIVLSETKLMLENKIGNEARPVTDLINAEIGKLWVKSTKLACKSKMYQQAQIYILNAEPYEPKDLFLEKAKLDWIKADQNNAFKVLELGIKKLMGEKKVEELSLEDKKIYVKGKLMCARYNAEAINLDFEANKKLFLEAKVNNAYNEKMFLLLAEYMDRFYCSDANSQMAQIGKPIHMAEVMSTYCRSMYHGNKHVFQSMPRFLSIWMDSTNKYSSSAYKQEIKCVNKVAEDYATKLDESLFYTAFSQLTSRICHASIEVFNIIKTILVKVIMAYPQQSFWFLIPMFRSSHNLRVKRCREIISDPKLANFTKMVSDFTKLNLEWVKLAQIEIVPKNSKTFSLKKIGLENLTAPRNTNIIMPFLANLQLSRVWNKNKFKFADNMVHIHRMRDKVAVMQSLMRPRKVTVIGDDGKEYSLLFKKDDLRIDLRFLEFSAILKEFLHKDPESRQRKLTTRTYAAIPLDEVYGVIEWVPNLRTYKNIITSEYARKGHQLPSHEEIKDVYKFRKEDRIERFQELVKIHYPALGDYFRKQFSSPQNYYNARLSFIRTTAAMSIIGYILGLGDRHGENILIDVCSGETFHVDFNMLFNRGENLTVPETVPFRLTHNMIDAMGVLGIEGPFRKSCEIFLRVMQKEKNTLMSYLRPLVYDVPQKTAPNRNVEHVEQESVEHIKNIEMRLKGIVRKYKGSSGIPLSTEGQVNFIIEEATDDENLSGMFCGWAPWI